MGSQTQWPVKLPSLGLPYICNYICFSPVNRFYVGLIISPAEETGREEGKRVPLLTDKPVSQFRAKQVYGNIPQWVLYPLQDLMSYLMIFYLVLQARRKPYSPAPLFQELQTLRQLLLLNISTLFLCFFPLCPKP